MMAVLVQCILQQTLPSWGYPRYAKIERERERRPRSELSGKLQKEISQKEIR